jgi:hypothetical protein
MAEDKMWQVRVVLSTGEARHLMGSQGIAEYAVNSLKDFEVKRKPFDGDWLETMDSSAVARAHIVEASVVPL